MENGKPSKLAQARSNRVARSKTISLTGPLAQWQSTGLISRETQGRNLRGLPVQPDHGGIAQLAAAPGF